MKVLKTIIATAVIVFALTTVAMAGVQHFTKQAGQPSGSTAQTAQPTYTVTLTAAQLAQLVNGGKAATASGTKHVVQTRQHAQRTQQHAKAASHQTRSHDRQRHAVRVERLRPGRTTTRPRSTRVPRPPVPAAITPRRAITPAAAKADPAVTDRAAQSAQEPAGDRRPLRRGERLRLRLQQSSLELGTPELMPTPPATAPDLVRGLQAGRPDAFERLYGEYHAPIYNLCARVLGDREEAKDVTQEVFIKAFDQLPAADAESFGLRPWLYRVATNACFNTLRSRRKLDGRGDAGLERTASGVDEFERAQTVALVEQSLGEMNERYRTALVLKDLQGLPPEEIAEVMEVSRANADVLVHRARASFKTVFAKLAGSDATAPAALGLVLVPLSVPAALQAMPPLPAHFAPVHGLPHPGIPATAGPAGAGLLTKIGAALTTKAAITAAAAAVVIGGGVVAVKEVDQGHS